MESNRRRAHLSSLRAEKRGHDLPPPRPERLPKTLLFFFTLIRPPFASKPASKELLSPHPPFVVFRFPFSFQSPVPSTRLSYLIVHRHPITPWNLTLRRYRNRKPTKARCAPLFTREMKAKEKKGCSSRCPSPLFGRLYASGEKRSYLGRRNAFSPIFIRGESFSAKVFAKGTCIWNLCCESWYRLQGFGSFRIFFSKKLKVL